MSTESENPNSSPMANSEAQDPTPGEATASVETSLDDEWAAALAEQSQAEEDPPPAEPLAATAEAPAAPEASLEDEWAAALAEQSQAEEDPPPSEPLTATAETPAAPEASLEDEWAAALEEQHQTDTQPDHTETSTSSDHTEAQDSLPHSTETETHGSSPPQEELENDWAEVLKDQTKLTLTDKPKPSEPIVEKEATDSHAVDTANELGTEEMQALAPKQERETASPQSETPHAEATPTENDSASEDSDQVVMNWPTGDSSQSQQSGASSEWKPTRLGSASGVEETSPEQELSLTAEAADASIQAVMEGADQVSEVLQNEQVNIQLNASGSESDQSIPQSTMSPQDSTPIDESTSDWETQDRDQGAQDPEPPIPAPSPPDIGQAPDRFRRPFFTGTGGSLFGMFTMNTLLTLLTFGVYSFWGRIKIRRYLHSQTKFAGARLAFHGTGAELFRGWMKAVLVFGLPYSALNYAGALQTEATFQWGVNIIAGLLILCFIPIAIVGSHRYRMSRTSWRGIYFSFRNSAKDFLALYLKGTFFSILTLGIYFPIFDNSKRAFLVSGTHFGSRAFGFDGTAKELGSIYFKAFRLLVLGFVTAEAVLLATSFLSGRANPNQVIDIVFWSTVAMVSMVIPFVVGLWFWFQAARQRYMWSHTTFGPARFRATMTGKALFELKSTNLFLLLCTLGFAWPWVQTRNLQFLYYHVGLQGPLNLKQVVQEASTASPMGEELAGFFDTGFDLG